MWRRILQSLRHCVGIERSSSICNCICNNNRFIKIVEMMSLLFTNYDNTHYCASAMMETSIKSQYSYVFVCMMAIKYIVTLSTRSLDEKMVYIVLHDHDG